ncbi:MAG: diguanylate cyclase domain-containing protein [Gammaproteobacteria bacterium]
MRDLVRAFGGKYTASLALYVAVYLLLAFGPWLAPANRSLGVGLGLLPVAALTIAASARTAASFRGLYPRMAHAWTYIALAFACMAGGDVVWIYIEDGLGLDPKGSLPVHLVYLAYYPLLLAGLSRFPRQALFTVNHSAGIAIGIALAGFGGLAVWYFIVQPAGVGNTAVTRLDQIISVVYPAADLLVLFAAARALSYLPSGPQRQARLLLAAGLFINTAVDLIWTYFSLIGQYQSGGPADALYALAYLLVFGAAELDQRFATGADRGRRASAPLSSVLAYTGMSIAVSVALALSLDGAQHGKALIVYTAILLLLLVAVAFREAQVQARIPGTGPDLDRLILARHTPEVLLVVARDRTIAYASPQVTRLLGHDPSALLGCNVDRLVHPDDSAGLLAGLEAAEKNADTVTTGDVRFRTRDGQWLWTEHRSASALQDPAIQGWILQLRDASGRRAYEAKLVQQAMADPLTGLANRSLLLDHLSSALARRSRNQRPLALLYIDLDGFKAINERHGHLCGDQILAVAAERVQRCLREMDTAARLNGDEFAILLEDVKDRTEILRVTARVLESLKEPIEFDGVAVNLGASIGIAEAEDRDTAKLLVERADFAMYRAKRAGRGRYNFAGPRVEIAETLGDA